jgi:hypothetical protein
MDEIRINAAIAELNALIQSLTQRCINLAADLAAAQAEIKSLKEKPVEDQ